MCRWIVNKVFDYICLTLSSPLNSFFSQDMVEFFGQQMDGMLFSQNGWVQSFGSRCVRPPTFWSDISRPKAMTVREYKVAQALTKKPVKGMVRKASRELMMIRNLCTLNNDISHDLHSNPT